MRIREGFFLHKIGDECIIMQDGTSNVDFGNLLNLNPTAAFLWTEIGNGEFDTESIVKLLTGRYEVSASQARLDAEAFIGSLRKANVVCD